MSNQSDTAVARFAFEKGWNYIRAIDQTKAMDDFKTLFGITTESNVYRRIRGEVEPTVTEYEGIETILKKYGVAKKNMWGTL